VDAARIASVGPGLDVVVVAAAPATLALPDRVVRARLDLRGIAVRVFTQPGQKGLVTPLSHRAASPWSAAEGAHPMANDPSTDRGERPGVDRTACRYALIIDDEAQFCGFIAMTLAAIGVESAAFPTAKSAIAALDERHPMIIFLDIALHNSDAIDVIRDLSGKGYRGTVQVVSGAKPYLLAAIQRTAAQHRLNLMPPLAKPVDDQMIRDVIAALDSRRAEAAN
jgi:ActR/RegA family two-component response regulator